MMRRSLFPLIHPLLFFHSPCLSHFLSSSARLLYQTTQNFRPLKTNYRMNQMLKGWNEWKSQKKKGNHHLIDHFFLSLQKSEPGDRKFEERGKESWKERDDMIIQQKFSEEETVLRKNGRMIKKDFGVKEGEERRRTKGWSSAWEASSFDTIIIIGIIWKYHCLIHSFCSPFCLLKKALD